MAAMSHERPPLADAGGHADAAGYPTHDLADLVLTFNLFPALYAHSTWLSCVCPRVDDSTRLDGSPLWVRALSVALLRRQRLHEHFDGDFTDPIKRLALVDAATLTRIAGLASAALLRNRLRRVVKREHVQAVQASLGVEAHLFAIRWQGPLPAVDPLTDGEEWPSAELWRKKSIALLFAVMPAQARGVMDRLRMRFPIAWVLPDPEQVPLAEPHRGNLARLLIAVARDSSAQWSWLFDLDAPADERLAARGAA